MKSKIQNLAIWFLLIFINSSLAQITFVKSYNYSGYPEGYAIQKTFDGGYIITGYAGTFIYLVKTNVNGDTLWTRTYGNMNVNSVGYSVQQTNDSGYVIVGTTESSNVGPVHVYLIKTNSNGDTLWTKSYESAGNDYGYSIKQTIDSGFIIAGATNGLGAGDYDVLVIKTNSIGDTLWSKTYGGDSSDYAKSVELTTDGGYIIAGYTNSFGAGGYDVYLIKTDSIGDTLWTKTYGGIYNDYGYSVKQTSDGGYIIAGRYWADFYLIKTNSIGDTIWTKAYYDPSNGASASTVQQTTDGGYIIVGTSENAIAFYFQILLIKTNSTGDTLWTNLYNDPYYTAYGKSVQQTSDGGYIIAGNTDYGMLVIKTDANGNSGCWQSNSNIIIDSIQTQVSNTTPIIKSGCIISNPSESVESGGTTVTTECFNTDINEISRTNYFAIYPNPAQDYFTIILYKESYNTNYEICNVLGEKIYSKYLIGKQAIENCNELSSGIYFIILSTGSDVVTKKLIIIK